MQAPRAPLAPHALATRVRGGRPLAAALVLAAGVTAGATAGATACFTGRPAPSTLARNVRVPRAPELPEGQGAVVGVVADSALGSAVVGASVYFTTGPLDDSDPPPVREGLPTASTDAAGGFVLAPVAPGRYTVAVRHLGFLPERRVVVLHSGGVDTVVVRLRGGMRLTR